MSLTAPRGSAARSKTMRRRNGAAKSCCGEEKKKEGEKGRSEGERASLCRSRSSYYL